MSKTIALIVGTRPEVIKLAPLYRELEASSYFNAVLIASGQHQSMAKQAFRAFQLEPHTDLGLMDENQTSNSFLSKLLASLPEVLEKHKPDLVVVQGDTTTSLGAAIAAFHLQIPVAHVEAGLRTADLASPFPEEMNRSVISRIATLHFAPTQRAMETLAAEKVAGDSFMVGNTAVDAVLWMNDLLESGAVKSTANLESLKGPSNQRLVLVTGHRRENFDQGLENLCSCLLQMRDEVEDIHIVYPVHLNPRVQDVVRTRLSKQERITLCDPLDYPSMVEVLKSSSLVITDSGGIQEEAPSFGKKVLVTRSCTERQEAIAAGTATLCPLDSPQELLATAKAALLEEGTLSGIDNPFGQGDTSKQIVEILARQL